MNKKRLRKNNSRFVLGRVPARRENIKILEKIIKKRLNPSDFYVEVGRPKFFGVTGYPMYTEDHARYLPVSLEKYRYLCVRSKLPNIKIEFTPFKTVISAQRIYANDIITSVIDSAVQELVVYLGGLQKTTFYIDFHKLKSVT